ncbi:MAG: hypothetical protein JW810_07360 [Sedimentisphaerales bacterium]|nr:hypothetical protein [Sedimentisphaerales bacterium]
MLRGHGKTLLLLVLAASLLAAAATRIPHIKQMRRQYDFDPADPFADSRAASELRLPTAALSIFRSLAIDYLWIRADTLKQEGQYFDALHLARLICALQPHLPTVWIFQAWNMAYNISVAMPNPPERWNWIINGISLLRDQALRYNPRTPEIYIELGWIFLHKLGGITDNYHRYYKRRYALEMMAILGPGPTTDEQIRSLADADASWEQLTRDPNVARLIEDIEKLPDKTLQTQDDFYRHWLRLRLFSQDYAPELLQFMSDHSRSYTWGKLDRFLRGRALRQDWKLDPRIMLELNQRYGPVDYAHQNQRLSLDWRQPFCQAIYWAWVGLPHAQPGEFQYMRLRQNIYQSMQNLYHYGRLQIFSYQPPPEATERKPGQELVDSAPRTELQIYNSQDLRMFGPAYQATLEVIQAYKDAGAEVPENIETASANLAWAGIENLFLAGYEAVALQYFQDLRRRFPQNRDYFMDPDIQKALIAFVQRNLRQEIKEISPKNAADYIDSLLRQSYSYFALDDPEQAAIFELRARQLYDYNESERAEAGSDRVKLPEYSQMRFLALMNFLNDPNIDALAKGVLMRRLQIQQPAVYNKVIEEIQKQETRRREPVAPSAP